mgnify:CR=1 FL=1|jgi:hypothetical protein
MYGSQHSFRHNGGSLRRAISAQTGRQFYPEIKAYPIDYDARYQAYGGWLQNLFSGGGKAAAGAGTEAAAGVAGGVAKTAAKSGGGFWSGGASGLIGGASDVVSGIFANKANANAMDAGFKSQEAIAAMKIQADKEVALASIAQGSSSGGSGGTIAIVAISLLAVGGLGYLVLRKKKK